MKMNDINGVKFLTFDIFGDIPWLKACFSTRLGGVSLGEKKSMNLIFRDDEEKNVRENYRRFCEACGFSYDGLTFSAQEHGTNIRRITFEDKGKGFFSERDYRDIDGIYTDEKGIALTTFYADCVPLYFCDVKKHVAGMSHAGWRGTVNKMAGKTVNFLISEFGCDIEDIRVGIGPSIGQCCFEVDFPVYEEFVQKLPFAGEYIVNKGNGKYLIDLKAINRRVLIERGVSDKNIEISDYCTKCETDLFFSHRRMGLNRGSMAGIVEIM
ncbi:MAG: peptidoglycan editing factor PgeF [Clostridiales bacterium]|jgi:YfiH family protein|nr:peptidoglycan editing factor PgeF [Clostridiales bacterium]